MVVNFTLDHIADAVNTLLQVLLNRKVIAFHGEMGAGKTTFIHALCTALAVEDAVVSPTFSIINEYRTSKNEVVYHMDLYRLQDEKEAAAAGIEDCIHSGNFCFVEWPEKAPGIFPADTVHCYLTYAADNTRKLKIKL